VVSFIISALTVLSFTLTPASQNIERAFLQNNPKLLYDLFSADNPLNVSLPEPIYFSDFLSNQQAFFFFKAIFSSYATFEFYSERQDLTPDKDHYIYKARWSFQDKKNNDQYLFYIFFYLVKDPLQADQPSETGWKITEIKAKKI
jgi:hypothetical protein